MNDEHHRFMTGRAPVSELVLFCAGPGWMGAGVRFGILADAVLQASARMANCGLEN
jgi:hypothetical protein